MEPVYRRSPRRMSAHELSGTSFQAPGRSRRGSETMKRESSPDSFKTGSSGYSALTWPTSVE